MFFRDVVIGKEYKLISIENEFFSNVAHGFSVGDIVKVSEILPAKYYYHRIKIQHRITGLHGYVDAKNLKEIDG